MFCFVGKILFFKDCFFQPVNFFVNVFQFFITKKTYELKCAFHKKLLVKVRAYAKRIWSTNISPKNISPYLYLMVYDIIIIGGGPIGLACGLEAKKAGLSYLIIEKGTIVNSLYNYPQNMTFFSTSERLEIGA